MSEARGEGREGGNLMESNPKSWEPNGEIYVYAHVCVCASPDVSTHAVICMDEGRNLDV